LSTAYSLAGDVAEEHPGLFTRLGAAQAGGMILGPLLVVWPVESNVEAGYQMALALGVAALAAVALVPETRDPAEKGGALKPFSMLWAAMEDAWLRRAALTYVWVMLPVGVYAIATLYFESRFSWSASEAGLSLAMSSATGVILNTVVVPALVPHRVSAPKALLASMSLDMVMMAVTGAVTSGPVAFWTAIPRAAIFVVPPLFRLQVAERHPGQQGLLQGILTSSETLVFAVAPAAYARIYAAGADHGVDGAPWYAASLAMAGGIASYIALEAAHKRKVNQELQARLLETGAAAPNFGGCPRANFLGDLNNKLKGLGLQ